MLAPPVVPTLQELNLGGAGLTMHSMPQVTCASCPHPSVQDGKVGLRWRTEKEVVAGKGQFVCGARGCDVRQGLGSFEVCTIIPAHAIRVQLLQLCQRIDHCR